jgi:hypothetical protein
MRCTGCQHQGHVKHAGIIGEVGFLSAEIA